MRTVHAGVGIRLGALSARVVLALAPVQVHDLEPTRPSPFDRVIALEIDASDALLEGRGLAEFVEYVPEFDGRLHVWTTVEGTTELDLCLRIERADSSPVREDDNSGGGSTPYSSFEVERGRTLLIVSAASQPGRVGRFSLHLVAAPETDDTRAAAEQAQSTVALLREQVAAGELDVARSMARDAIGALGTVAGGEHSERVSRALWTLGMEAYGIDDQRQAVDAWTRVLRHRSRTHAPDHRELQGTRGNVAAMLEALGDFQTAKVLGQEVLDAFVRTRPPDDVNIQMARRNLALTLMRLGEIDQALAMQEQVLEVLQRTLPDDHEELTMARGSLATALMTRGEYTRARSLAEKVEAVHARTLPEDHPLLQRSRANLAMTLQALGDYPRARALGERVLEVLSKAYPEDHLDLQAVRGNLAVTLRALGETEGVRALEEQVLAVLSRSLPEDNFQLLSAQLNLAGTIKDAGDLEGARALEAAVLEVCERTRPEANWDRLLAASNLAVTLKLMGELDAARELEERVVATATRSLPDGFDGLRRLRSNLVVTIALQAARDRAGAASPALDDRLRAEHDRGAQLVRDLCRAQVHAAWAALLTGSVREAEERCGRLGTLLGLVLSFAQGYGVFDARPELEREALVLSETTRSAALVSAALSLRAAGSRGYAELREDLRRAGDELAALSRAGATSESYQRALAERESAERALLSLACELSDDVARVLQLDVDAFGARLRPGEAAIGFRSYQRAGVEWRSGDGERRARAVENRPVDHLCAFVVRRGTEPATASVVRVELGPVDRIERAVESWRVALGGTHADRGVGVAPGTVSADDLEARGTELRELVLDPLQPALAGVERAIFALDDVLHLVPLDALPAGGGALAGERWRIETRATLTELLRRDERPIQPGDLVAIGAVEYGAAEVDVEDGTLAAATGRRTSDQAGSLRGGAWCDGFSPLPATDAEVRGIARYFTEQSHSDRVSHLCQGADATRERLALLAPSARWLHIATHGWFAPESILSWNDRALPNERMGAELRAQGAEQARRMSPMLLCGIALAGASLPADPAGRVPGLITAEELSTLDLANCELAVLSACETNVGTRRAGQGVASLQRALHMAGARSVITSLWKVPDEATKELMLDFYRRLWVEKKPKWRALWEAKMSLRNAKDEHGAPKYSTRDWAAWVLTGEPD